MRICPHDLCDCEYRCCEDLGCALMVYCGAPERPLIRPVSHVLVKLYSDGRVEVFGERSVFVEVVELPGGTNADEEALLERWLDEWLPLPYREVHWPGRLRGGGVVKPFRSFWSFVKGWLWAEAWRGREKDQRQEAAADRGDQGVAVRAGDAGRSV
jgi:hypothetical protein